MEKGKIDITLLIVLITGAAYGVAFLFEYSYQSYYKLPTVFIDLNITTLTKSLSYTLIAVGVLFSILNFIVFLISLFFSFKIEVDTLMKQVSLLVLVFTILMLIAFVYGEHKASIKEEYMILKHEEELYVVVTSYSII
ncbi:hypothetical protein R6U76_19835 [Lysinibacillus capsici]|uniref:hypothetical protein n=1 Tax=Lysinibacillus capsici TaxID=2115968 RepID=UPI0029DE7FB4|nr:hypothetical protein [Lysinibacillus capsici]WPK04852.1 hypothetical protein R6U76_19835 [Lysinibacillus capsici]